jgi:hypothetical protein
MPPDTEVITCPACKHLLRVPADWLGQTVQCPECKATFRAPVRDGDRQTEPELIAGPPAAGAPARKPTDAALWLPAFGLMLVGFASTVANGWLSTHYLRDRDDAKRDVLNLIEQARKSGRLTDGPADPDERRKFDEQRAGEYGAKIRVVVPVFAVVGVLEFAGGLAIVLRRGYRLAQVGCVVAVLNVPHGCCIPGAVFGVWGLLMLMSEEGRAHFS